MSRKRAIDIEVDQLTNSIVNVVTGEVFETVFSRVSPQQIRKRDWLFDWKSELKDKDNLVYKMTTVNNEDVIQGMISLSIQSGFVFVNLVENAKFNKGRSKLYEGVGGNLFAFACKVSADLGHGGCVSFVSKSSLIEYYRKALGAIRTSGHRMIILEPQAEELINRYFKPK